MAFKNGYILILFIKEYFQDSEVSSFVKCSPVLLLAADTLAVAPILENFRWTIWEQQFIILQIGHTQKKCQTQIILHSNNIIIFDS